MYETHPLEHPSYPCLLAQTTICRLLYTYMVVASSFFGSSIIFTPPDISDGGARAYQERITLVWCWKFSVMSESHLPETYTLPKTNIAPKNGGFQQESPFPGIYVQVLS